MRFETRWNLVPHSRISASCSRRTLLKFKISVAGIVILAISLIGAVAHAQALTAKAPNGTVAQLVILDTDIGDDIDDAFAVAVLLNSPGVRLLGINTAYGDTELRARLVDRYLKAAGRTEIPVHAGSPTKAINHFTQSAYALADPARKHRNAVSFLLDQIKLHPGQITLVAIGPLSNEREAITRDPATFRKLKRVIIMGGSVRRGYDDLRTGDTNRPPSPEWNIVCDPAAARALLASGVPVFMMPLDSTQIHLTQKELSTILAHGSALTDQLTLLYHEWTGAGEWRMPTLFDPVAAMFATAPEICPVQAIRVEVDDMGYTREVQGVPNVQVCLRSDRNAIVQLLDHEIIESADPAPDVK
jgi:inosine-uridine nucleoside N-ribohydrolase